VAARVRRHCGARIAKRRASRAGHDRTGNAGNDVLLGVVSPSELSFYNHNSHFIV
jgi:hypothetical protein